MSYAPPWHVYFRKLSDRSFSPVIFRASCVLSCLCRQKVQRAVPGIRRAASIVSRPSLLGQEISISQSRRNEAEEAIQILLCIEIAFPKPSTRFNHVIDYVEFHIFSYPIPLQIHCEKKRNKPASSSSKTQVE